MTPGTSPTDKSGAPAPIVFEMPIEVTDAHVDAPGHHVNNVVYLRWAQEVATAHWRSRATEEQQAAYLWVVRRHEIDYLRPAFPGEHLIARTYVGEATGATFVRHVELWRDGVLITRARSTWVAVDSKTGRPKRIPHDMTARFHETR